jgi:acylphosphatase
MGSAHQRREVHYSGRVQGVGFRYTAQSIASRHEVTGFVRNLPDGRVHLVVEGERSEVKSFLDDLARTMGRYIQKAVVQEGDATGRFSGFSIRH